MDAGATIRAGFSTAPLRGFWTHQRGAFTTTGATLADVVTHYDQFFQLNPNEQQKRDLVEYLKSL